MIKFEKLHPKLSGKKLKDILLEFNLVSVLIAFISEEVAIKKLFWKIS